jgi:hypothetical protein
VTVRLMMLSVSAVVAGILMCVSGVVLDLIIGVSEMVVFRRMLEFRDDEMATSSSVS